MQRRIALLWILLVLTGCSLIHEQESVSEETGEKQVAEVSINLSDSGITVDGDVATNNMEAAVYVTNDIIYYEAGRDFTYGEGTEEDAHSAEEAAAHTVVHITQPGTYVLRGTLSAGQIAVDLGEGAEEDPNAVVTLILNGVNIGCTVAPAVIFYNVYECGSKDAETASRNVDTSAAGANVVIADGSYNVVNGSYVARIYKPDSVKLSEDGTEVLDAKKLHKYDAAFYSKMSMNVDGGERNSGTLYITAENEGLDSELHLTINGGIVDIVSGNDGINTNEDGVSVTTINDGFVNIVVSGETGEGDGIDSNGWLVINGGMVIAEACENSADSGIDSDMGIHINGGFVIATGHMLDRIEDGGQNYAVFGFAEKQQGGTEYTLKSEDGSFEESHTPDNAFTVMLYSNPGLTTGTYTFWQGETQLAHSGADGGMMGGPGGMGGGFRPDGGMSGAMQSRPEDMEPPEGDRSEMPEGMKPPRMNVDGIIPLPEGTVIAPETGTITLPDGTKIQVPAIGQPIGQPGGFNGDTGYWEPGEQSEIFTVDEGRTYFNNVSAVK